MLKEEVEKLKDNGFICDALYPKWVPNPVWVKKSNMKWMICVNYSDLNKACPKGSFSLSKIDQLVDSIVGYDLLSFMYSYSGYNQISVHVPDREHTSLILDLGLYCYRVMSFGLKNAGATYQRLVNMMFKDQIE